ncbi:MAG: hypothetical protein ACO1N1_25955 [Dyadobacter fermentans]
MRKIYSKLMYAIFVCLSLTLQVFGQESKQETDVNVKYRWDVSLDLYQLFYNGGGNVMLRYMPNNKYGAYRFQIGSSHFSNRNSRTPSIDTTTNQPTIGAKYQLKGANVDIKIGYEFHKGKGRHQVFFGGDLGYSYDYGNNNYNGIGTYRNNTVALYPFIGVKYRILNRLSLSTEMTVRTLYYVQKQYDSRDNLIADDKMFAVNFVPLRLINVSYHF